MLRRGCRERRWNLFPSLPPPSVTFPDFCLCSSEVKHGAAPRVMREAAIQAGDSETLGFDYRLAHPTQETLLLLTDRDIQ